MERLGSKMIEMHKISKAFKENVILDQFDYNFQRNDRIGIIGKNGTGKSTFLNLLTDAIKPDSGKIIRGETLKFGYYTQSGIKVKERHKVIEVIQEFGEFIPLKKGKKISAQQLLERFLFDRKKQYDLVEKLSGGERKRLYLCTILIQNPNFLILDEPTNDLDIVTLNVLESFLLDFPGCLLVVSHDRYFMDKIVDHLFILKGQGIIEDFPGNYSDYRAYEGEAHSTKLIEEKKTKKDWKLKESIKTSFSYDDQQSFKKLENNIRKIELKKLSLQNRFANETISAEEIKELSVTLKELENTLEEKTNQWLEYSIKMEG
jgi:ATP-binding cassette subfamily F protein uup